VLTDILNGFRFVSLLMTGQTSQVWLVARDRDNERFALKLLLPEALRQQMHRQFLSHEAHVGMALDHPSAISVYDYFPHRREPHFVMEYFQSVNLKLRIIRKDEMIREHAVKIITQTAEALGHMHDRKWVHKDVKPDNVLVNDQGDVRLIDFALADHIQPAWRRLLMGKPVIMGTRSYMSPEQIRGRPLDGRSDLYSFGVVLFEMLAGRVPFVAESANLLLHKHLAERPPSPKSFNADVSSEMEAIVMTLLAKKPEDRFSDVAEFLAQFQRVELFEKERA